MEAGRPTLLAKPTPLGERPYDSHFLPKSIAGIDTARRCIAPQSRYLGSTEWAKRSTLLLIDSAYLGPALLMVSRHHDGALLRLAADSERNASFPACAGYLFLIYK